MKKIISIILMIAAALQVSAQSTEISGVKYTVNKKNKSTASALITQKCPANVEIPEKVAIKGKTYTVDAVRVDCKEIKINGCYYHVFEPLKSVTLSIIADGYIDFYGCVNLEKVTINPGLTRLFEATFSICKKLKYIDIPNTIKRIDEHVFSYCDSLERVVIPNSVDTIEAYAFSGCHNLKEIIVPDKEFTFLRDRKGGGEVFSTCEKIENIRCHNGEYPKYIVECSKYNSRYFESDSRCPFFDKIPSIRKLYSYFAKDKILDRMKLWQQKKEYETTAQWKARVTAEEQKQQLAKVTDEVRKEYIAQFAPKTAKGTLGTFDADYGTYPVTMDGVANTFYAQVPLSDAQKFKENWSKVSLQPQYGIVDDQLGVLSCTFSLDGKTYKSTRNYSNDANNDFAIDMPPIELDLGSDVATAPKREATPTTIDYSIDRQIPTSNTTNSKTFAVIIGNENYQRVAKVEYAKNDAKVFGEYCQKTLGLPANNIRRYTDATFGTMLAALKDIKSIADAYKGDLNVIFYYAGHGVPDGTGRAYLLPVDADGSQPEVCLATSRLYKELNSLRAKSVVVFMDACFSGAQRGEGMLTAARGVALKAKSDVPEGNCVVFSAADGEETAFPYKEKGHGMFTYFLLKKLQETKGDVTLGELGEYIQTNVQQQAVVVNRKPQHPTVVPSANAGNWRSVKLR